MLANHRYSLGGMNFSSAYNGANAGLSSMFYDHPLYGNGTESFQSAFTPGLSLASQQQQSQQPPGSLSEAQKSEDDMLFNLDEDDYQSSLQQQQPQQQMSQQNPNLSLGLDMHRTPRTRSGSFQNYGSGFEMYPEVASDSKRARLGPHATQLKKGIQPSLPIGAFSSSHQFKNTFQGPPASSAMHQFRPTNPPSSMFNQLPMTDTTSSTRNTSIDSGKNNSNNRGSGQQHKSGQSQKDQQAKRRPLTSKYRGVCWYKRTKRWVVQIKVNGIRRHVGYFKDEIDAAIAYDNALKELSQLPPPPKKEKTKKAVAPKETSASSASLSGPVAAGAAAAVQSLQSSGDDPKALSASRPIPNERGSSAATGLASLAKPSLTNAL